MDLETAGAIERLSERIDSLESSFRAELRSGLAEVRAELRGEFQSGLAEVRRHAVMLNEATRDDIRLVAEAVAAIAVKIDSLQP